MGEKLKAEIKQSKPFSSLAEEALLNLERTADCLRRELQKALKPFGITHTQYNALRILRGAKPGGLACSELGSRLVSSDPDITRLLERLARLGLITRKRAVEDRRVVMTEIAPAGLDLLASLVPIADERVRRSLAHIDEESIRKFIDLLEEVRSPHVSPVEQSA